MVTPRPSVIVSPDVSAVVLVTSLNYAKNPKTLLLLGLYAEKPTLLITEDTPNTNFYKDQEIPNTETSTKRRTINSQAIPHKKEIQMPP